MSPRLLLIHGYVSNPEAWAPLRRELEGDVGTFAPYLPGYGGEPDPASYTLEGVAAAFDDVVEAVKPDYLLGHSMGALVALGVASRHPGRFKRVGLAGLPVYDTIEEGLRYIGSRSISRDRYMRNPGSGHFFCRPVHSLRYLWGPFAHLAKPDYPLPMIIDMFNHSSEAHRGGMEDIVFSGHARRLAPEMGTPVALIHGDADRVTPLEPVVELARERGWPLRIAHGAGHELTFAQPRGMARWVRERLLAPIEAEAAPEDEAAAVSASA